VELWSRSRPAATGSWSAWSRIAHAEGAQLWASFGSSSGFYEFATLAADAASNREALPASGDVSIWYGPERVNDDTGTGYPGTPKVVMGQDGSTYAIWTDGRNSTTYDLYFAKRLGSYAWGANQRVDDTTAATSAPALAVDATGSAYALWVDARNGDKDIWFSKRSATTGACSASVRVNDDAAGSVQDSPAIAILPNGEAIAIWTDARSRKEAVYSARLAAGSGTWSPNVKVSTDTSLAKTGPDIAIGSNGVAYATWTQTKNGKGSVRFTTLPSGDPCGRPTSS
jgi:hypothetical protein